MIQGPGEQSPGPCCFLYDRRAIHGPGGLAAPPGGGRTSGLPCSYPLWRGAPEQPDRRQQRLQRGVAHAAEPAWKTRDGRWGVGERSRSLGDFPHSAMNRPRRRREISRRQSEGLAQRATFAAPEPAIYQIQMRSRLLPGGRPQSHPTTGVRHRGSHRRETCCRLRRCPCRSRRCR